MMNKFTVFSIVIYYVIGISDSKVCTDDFTITPDNWSEVVKEVKKCKIIEGSLKIQLLDFKNVNSKFSLEKLTMVTDYVIIHRINGKILFTDLLPNLRVIRGRKLHKEFSLVIVANFEMQQFGELKLEILHGSVAFEDNIRLCLGRPLKWKKVTTKDWKDNRFVNNGRYCFEDCLAKAQQTEVDCSGKGDCTQKDIECHKECVGGCSEKNNDSKCTHCRHLIKNGRCYRNCPEGYLQYMNYRCIKREDCYNSNTNKGIIYQKQGESGKHCVSQCPTGYNASIRNEFPTCTKLDGTSRCHSTTITSTNMGKSLQGCTVLNGNLTIALYERANISEILQYTENIVKVTGNIQVIGASLLYSISNILPRLEEISGKEMVNHGGDSYALYLVDNKNLRELWNFQNKGNLIIHGNVYVVFNEMLCISEIEQLYPFVSKPFTVYQVSNSQCKIENTKLVAIPGSTVGTVHLHFDHSFERADNRWYQGYYIYYKETKNVISVYEDRDPYNDEKVWTRISFGFTDVPRKVTYKYTIRDLKPNSTYAIYIESFASEKEEKAIQSKVVYVDTLAKNPSNKIKTYDKIFDSSNNMLSMAFESEEPDVFYDILVEFQLTENVPELPGKNLPSMDAEKTDSTSGQTVNDYFTYLPGLEEISCDGRIDMQKIINIQERTNQWKSVINGELYFLDVHNDADLKYNKVKRAVKTDDILPVNWSQNEISFSFIPNDQNWTESVSMNGTVWNMRTVTNKSSFRVEVPFDYINYKVVYRKTSVQACRNLVDNCTYLKKDLPCAQCSPSYIRREEYETKDALNVAFEIYTLNETEHLTEVSNHTCAGHVVGKNIKVGWQEDQLAISYTILVTGHTNEIYRIWVNADVANELNHICNLPLNSTEVSVSVSVFRRRIRSLGSSPIYANSESYSDNNIIVVWIVICVLISLLVIIFIGVKIKNMNGNRQFFVNQNTHYGRETHKERNRQRPEAQTAADLQKEALALQEKVQSIMITDEITISIDNVGNGKFGTVYKAKLNCGEEVVVKIYEPKNYSLLKANKIAANEMEICRSLDNKYIVKGYGITVQKNIFCQVFEFIDGINLQDYIQKNDISAKEKNCIATQASMGLEYLDKQKIVHGDFASRNVMIVRIENEISIKIIDFGHAKHLISDSKKQGFEEAVKYIPLCSAPECWKSEPQLYRNSDIWSLGLLLYELCKGESLFKGILPLELSDTLKNLYNSNGTPPSWSEYKDSPFEKIKHLPKDRMTIVLSMCLKKYCERPHVSWIIGKLTNEEDIDEIRCDSFELSETNKEIELMLQNGDNHSIESHHNSFCTDDEEAPCLTPDEMSGGMSCISLHRRSRNVHRFDEKKLGKSLPI